MAGTLLYSSGLEIKRLYMLNLKTPHDEGTILGKKMPKKKIDGFVKSHQHRHSGVSRSL
jgi:hypothetical protein